MYKAKSKKADSVLKYRGSSSQGTLALGTKFNFWSKDQLTKKQDRILIKAWKGGGGAGGDSAYEGVGMLVVWLRSVNFGF